MERYRVIGLVAFFLALIALILPWFEYTSILGRIVSYGFSGDGALSFILLAICLGLLLTRPKRWKKFLAVFLAFIALIIATITINRVMSTPLEMGILTAGPGGPLMIIASIAFMIAAITQKT